MNAPVATTFNSISILILVIGFSMARKEINRLNDKIVLLEQHTHYFKP